MLLHVTQQSLNILFQHWQGTFAQLERAVVLLELREDGAVLEFEFDQNSCQLQKGLFLWRF